MQLCAILRKPNVPRQDLEEHQQDPDEMDLQDNYDGELEEEMD